MVEVETDRYLIFMDINNFKIINDTHGHGIGDLVIGHFGDVLVDTFYKDQAKIIDDKFVLVPKINSVVSRFGGDEFIVLTNLARDRELNILIRSLHKNLLQKFEVENVPFEGLSVSAGIINMDNIQHIKLSYATESTQVGVADLVMYFAKELGKRKFATEQQKIRPGFVAVRQWDDFDAIAEYSKLRTGPKLREKAEEIEKQMFEILDNFYERHKELLSYLEDKRNANIIG